MPNYNCITCGARFATVIGYVQCPKCRMMSPGGTVIARCFYCNKQLLLGMLYHVDAVTGHVYCDACYLKGNEMNYFTVSNGDTDEYTCFSWPLWDVTGKSIKAILDFTIDKGSKNWHPVRKVWFIHNSVADAFLNGIKTLISATPDWQIKDQRTTVEAFNDFFETPPPVGQAPKTKAELLVQFSNLIEAQAFRIEQPISNIELNDIKKLYRKAALALHPDRNNGDGSKMAELNIIWAELQTKF